VPRTRKTTAPALSACRPRGSLAAPVFTPTVCRCGELVEPVHVGGPEWSYADAAGRTWLDLSPAGWRDNPAAWWDRLAQNDIGAYSLLRARQSLGMLGWSHHHSAGSTAPYAVTGPRWSTLDPSRADPPFCHGSPMWASPAGWVCRGAGYRSTPFPYEHEGRS
jgi:hypothetical protein